MENSTQNYSLDVIESVFLLKKKQFSFVQCFGQTTCSKLREIFSVWSISAMRRILYTMVQFRPLRKPFRQTDFLHLIFTYFIESPSSSLCIIVASGKFAGGSFPGDFTCFSPSRPAWSFDGSSRAHSPAIMSSHLGHFLDRISGLILPMKKGPKQCLLWQDSI